MTLTQSKSKSRTFRRVEKVTPGHKNVRHFIKKKPARATCAVTGEKLQGVPHVLAGKLRNMPKSSKRPERPFGGVLSSKAMRDVMRKKARDSEL